MDKKKILVPTIIAVLTLIVMVVGATYAYFSVATTNNFGTRTVTASAADVGSVALATGSNLYLNLSRVNMMQANTGTYYAVTDSAGTATKTATTANIATATVTGSGTFTCNYTLSVAQSGTMKNALTGVGTAILVVNGTEYDVYSTTFPKTISGTMTGLTSEASQNITAQFKFVNTSSNQDVLKGTNITLTFTATAFSCTATA